MTDVIPFGLTPVMRDALLVIQELSGAGVAPSYSELQRELGLSSKGNVKRVLDRLEARGWIARQPKCARSIIVLRPLPLPEDVEFVGLFDAPELFA